MYAELLAHNVGQGSRVDRRRFCVKSGMRDVCPVAYDVEYNGDGTVEK
jgi:hypothetical protein